MSKTTHINPVSGRPFKAEEAAPLDNVLRQRRFAEPKWATFQQWKGTGRLVRKGEQGTELTGASGFKWRVFNVSQTETVEAEAARAPVAIRAPSPKATPRKAKSTRAPESKKIVPRGAPSAPAVKAKPPLGTPAPLPNTPESAREIVRLNPFYKLTPSEARELVVRFPTRRFFDPEEVASIYGTGPAASATEQGAFRVAEAKRWLALWQNKAKTSTAIGKLKTIAWLKFTGRETEARLYGKRRPGVDYRPATVETAAPATPEPVEAPAPEPAPAIEPAAPAPAPAASEPKTWRERFVARFNAANNK